MIWNMVLQYFDVPLAHELLEFILKVGTEEPRSTKRRCFWSGFSSPPMDGWVDCLEGQTSVWFLDVVGKVTKGIM